MATTTMMTENNENLERTRRFTAKDKREKKPKSHQQKELHQLCFMTAKHVAQASMWSDNTYFDYSGH